MCIVPRPEAEGNPAWIQHFQSIEVAKEGKKPIKKKSEFTPSLPLRRSSTVEDKGASKHQ